MTATVFIPTGNRAKSLKKVLDSLLTQTYKKFEVIIVDYKSNDETPSIIEQFQKRLELTIIHQKEKGLVNAANLALKKAKGDIFIRIDDDVVTSPNWLEAIHETFHSDRKVGGVTGPTVIPPKYARNRDLFVFENKFKKGNIFWKVIGTLYFGYFMEGNPRRVSQWYDSGAFSLGSNFPEALKQPLQEVTNLEACNWAVRTKLLKKVNGFDEIYGGVGEYHEADAAFKIKDLGYKLIFNPTAYLNHRPSQDGFFKDRPASYSRMINFVVFYMRHIKPNSLTKCLRFISYLVFLNSYYVSQAVLKKQINQLGAIPGTGMGFIRYVQTKH